MRDKFINGNRFKALCDFYLDETNAEFDLTKEYKRIFLYTDWVERFRQRVLPRINYQFTLITHNADREVGGYCLPILNDNRVLKWYGMNCSIVHPKLVPIPIGVANEKWTHGNLDTLETVCSDVIEKNDRVYCNFDPNTSPIRRNLLNSLSKYDFVDIETNRLNFEDYLRKLKSYKYVISPPGNSADCHRIWESIYMDTIPIILNNVATNGFSEELPIISIDSYTNLSKEYLDLRYSYIKNRNKRKSYIDFYKDLVYS